jgi:hypothetical protein
MKERSKKKEETSAVVETAEVFIFSREESLLH